MSVARHLVERLTMYLSRQSGGFSSTWTNASYECSGNSPQYAGIVFYGLSLARSVSAIIGPIISGLLLEAGI